MQSKPTRNYNKRHLLNFSIRLPRHGHGTMTFDLQDHVSHVYIIAQEVGGPSSLTSEMPTSDQ